MDEYRPSLRAIRAEMKRIERRRERKKEIWGMTFRILFVAMAVVLFNTYVLRIASVNGASMEPALKDGDVVLCSMLGYKPDYGDIVITEMDLGEGSLVKRVIALPGDTIDFDYEAGAVLVNGTPVEEPYLKEKMRQTGDVGFPAVVPEGRVFLLGDNRNHSIDSRTGELGMVPECTIMGKVVFRIFPIGSLGTVAA